MSKSEACYWKLNWILTTARLCKSVGLHNLPSKTNLVFCGYNWNEKMKVQSLREL